MSKPNQAEIWWAELPGRFGRRPVLILTRSGAINQLSNVSVAPLSRTIRYIESEVVLSPQDGVPSICAIALDNIMTIKKSALDRRLTTLSGETMLHVFSAIRFAFAMPNHQ